MRAGLALRAVGALVIVATVLSLTACGSASKAGRSAARQTVLQVELSIGVVDTVHAWAKAVEERSGGTLRIDIEVNPLVHGKSPEVELRVLQRVRRGAVPVAAIGARAFDLVGVRSFQPLLAPFLIDSYDLQQQVLASSLAPHMLRGTKRIGLVGLAILPGPQRRMLGMARPFREPHDFRGSIVGLQEGDVAATTIRTLGGVPRAEAQEARHAGLDAYEQQLGSTAAGGLYRDARYMTTDLALWPRPIVVVANEAAYARLTPTQREALASAGQAGLEASMQTVRTNDRDGRAVLCTASVRNHFSLVASSPAQRAAMRRAVVPVYAQLERDSAVAAAIRRIEAMKPEAKPDPPVACPSAARFGPERRRTPIDGVWVMDSSRADVSAAQRNADVENTHPENLGHYVYVFDRGRFADTQRYEDACTWGYGKYTVNGHTMRWLFTDGGGISPNGAYSKPGEDFKFTWSRYRDTLTVGPVKRAISPLNFRLRSWHRVGAKASDNVFDKRCPPPPQWDSP